MTTIQASILEQLQDIRGGASYHEGALGPEPFRIEIRGLGPLTFPLNPIQNRVLMSYGIAAPFGKGHETIVDESVRKTWEIDAADLVLKDKGWKKRIKSFLAEVAQKMDLTVGIKAKPYKLLIYETGGFFAEHQDSEKIPGMFGTLLVGLPSEHAGGEIVLDPGDGERVTIDFSQDNATSFPAVAFIADRKHEILPVTDGYRTVLVYNLVYAKSPATRPKTATVATSLSETLQDLKTTEYQIIALDHQYTDTNFSANTLKGNDVARVAALRAAAKAAGMNIRVGLIEHHETCNWENAHEFGSGYDYYSRRRSYRSERVQKSEPESFSEVEVGESYDGHLTMGQWLDGDGPDLGALNIDADEILRRPGHEKDEPIEWSVEGYQGNWGMTTDFTYRYAGVILWHPAATGRVLGLLPLAGRVAWAADYAAQLKKKPKDAGLRQQLLSLEESIQAATSQNARKQVDAAPLTEMLSGIVRTKGMTADELYARWDGYFFEHFNSFAAKDWKTLIDAFGSGKVSDLFTRVGNEPLKGFWVRKEDFVVGLLQNMSKMAKDKHEGTRKVGLAQVARIPTMLHVHYPEGDFSAEVVWAVLKTASQHEVSEQWEELTGKCLLALVEQPEYLHDTLGKALKKAKPVSALYSKLFDATIDELKKRLNNPPQPFTDYARKVPKGYENDTKAYPDFLAFLIDPVQKTFDLKKPQSDRDQLSRFIEWNKLDVRQETIRTRPAHTLRLTKTDASYQRALRQREQDEVLLKAMG